MFVTYTRDGQLKREFGDKGTGDGREESGRKNSLERKLTLYGGRSETVGGRWERVSTPSYTFLKFAPSL